MGKKKKKQHVGCVKKTDEKVVGGEGDWKREKGGLILPVKNGGGGGGKGKA